MNWARGIGPVTRIASVRCLASGVEKVGLLKVAEELGGELFGGEVALRGVGLGGWEGVEVVEV